MRVHTIRPLDLFAVAGWTVLTLLAVALDAPGYLRVPLGLAFVLFVPGYAFLAALYPERHRTIEVPKGEDGLEVEEVKKGLEPLERTALSMGLSIAIVPLLGLALNYTPWGIRLVPIAITLTLFTVVCLVVAYQRRQNLPDDEVFLIDVNWSYDWANEKPIDRALTVALAIAVVVALGVLIYVLVTPRDGEAFTEFYILGPTGKAACYPSEFDGQYHAIESDEILCPDPIQNITIGIVNHEKRDQTYWIQTVWTVEERQPDNTTIVQQLYAVHNWTVTLPHVKVNLEPGAAFQPQYETNYTLTPPPTNGTLRLSFQLFLEPPQLEASKAYMESPYRRLHVWIDQPLS